MNHVFLDILVVLVAAKLAAELAERVGVPAVVGEILAGIAIGPSVLGMVETNEVLHVLGEIGVILLLLEVGMQMDLRELRAVGRASMTVAVLGVAAPFAAGYPVAALFGLDSEQTLFVSAALTATSVGITARVFGDLRALATIEARTVLGAAVADDVMGLVILTVVVRIVSGDGGVSATGVGQIVGVAIAFLVLATVVGSVVAPRLFAGIDRFARSSGTLFALALAFTLGVAELATAAKLAPIVGAFVAGLALGRSTPAQRIQRELTPVGHLFIPVFFLQIGIDTDVGQFFRPSVLGLAGALIAVAIAGKLLAGAGAFGTPGSKLVIGLGMIPRGEVGLIFAGIGLREGVLGQDAYAAILLMVLVTTLVTPPLLRWRLLRLRQPGSTMPAASVRPDDGWLHTGAPVPAVGRSPHGTGPTVVELAALPGAEDALAVAFDAAILVEQHTPGPQLLAWLAERVGPGDADHGRGRPAAMPWTSASTQGFLRFLEEGGPRGWRFLETTGVLGAVLPEIDADLRRRRHDPSVLDPLGVLRWPLLERVRALAHGRTGEPGDDMLVSELARLDHRSAVLLAALLVDATTDDPSPLRVAGAVLGRLALDGQVASSVAGLVDDRELLRAAAVRPDGLREESVLRIAAHLRTREQARALYVLSAAAGGLEAWERALLDELLCLVLAGLDHPELTGSVAVSLVDRKRSEAIALAPPGSMLADRIALAPLAYLLAEELPAIVRQVGLIEPIPTRGRFRVEVTAEGPGRWRVEIGGRDQLGLLALVTGVLEDARLDVDDALVATWGDGGALQAFRVRTDAVGVAPDPQAIVDALVGAMHRELIAAAVPDAVVSFDGTASPWHTIAEVRATDRRGLLHALAVAFAAAGADVHAARVTTTDEMALDRFDLTDRHGRKLDDTTKAAIRRALQFGVQPRTRRPWRANRVGTIRKS